MTIQDLVEISSAKIIITKNKGLDVPMLLAWYCWGCNGDSTNPHQGAQEIEKNPLICPFKHLFRGGYVCLPPEVHYYRIRPR